MRRWRVLVPRRSRVAVVAAAAVVFACAGLRVAHPARRAARFATERPDDDGVHANSAPRKRARAAARRGSRISGCRIGRSRRHLKRAVLVAEDAAFWDHDGVDYDELRAVDRLRLAERAAFAAPRRSRSSWRRTCICRRSRNPYRKVVELIITRRLEAELSKTRIFELYLNYIEWGDGIWGAEAAARAYFGRSAVGSVGRAGRTAGRRDHQPAHLLAGAAERAPAPAPADHSAPHGRAARSHAADDDLRPRVTLAVWTASSVSATTAVAQPRARQYGVSNRSTRTTAPVPARARTSPPSSDDADVRRAGADRREEHQIAGSRDRRPTSACRPRTVRPPSAARST